MLVLTRRKQEKVVIGDRIAVTILEVQGQKVRLGIEAPDEVPVHREEVQKKISSEEKRDLVGAAD